jgi:DNA-binding Lrp family transcriptional regulator
MVHAFIMVKTAAGKSEALVSEIRSLAAVDRAHVIAGEWDLVVEVDAAAVYDVLHSAAAAIRDFEGVSNTKTYVSLG